MKNPLNRRLPREFKSEIGKYIVIFIFMTAVIGFVSGCLVAGNSMKTAYNESFETYNIEDGNFELAYKADDAVFDLLKDEDITIYENYYVDKETKEVNSTLRIFQKREKVNLECLMEGKWPEDEKEVAIDRMYADNNAILIGDILTVGNKELTVTGYVALSDYSALYSSPADMMFDATQFGVAIMTEEGFESFGEGNLHYSYSWKYEEAPKNDKEAQKMSEDFLEVLSENAMVTNYIPQYSNQAIHFAGNDIGKDGMMFNVFLYVVIMIIAFIFAITTSNTIAKEAAVIGTLRASGYTRGELMRHYLAMPVFITLLSAIIGNVLGYTIFKDFAVNMYYGSYSLPTFVTLWNANAFIKTTVIPGLLMIVINVAILSSKLKLSPMKFLRRDLSKRKKKKAFRLNTKIGIMKRFRLRIVFQNMPNYITIVFGILLANLILLLGVAFPALLEKYEEDITSNMICEYQYILKAPMETEMKDAEKYCAGSLQYADENGREEGVTLFGLNHESKYIKLELEDNHIYVSNAFSEKYGVSVGETVTLQETYGDESYSFVIDGLYYYPSGIAVFMDREYFNELFGNEADYFNGYLSDTKIDDIDEMYIATKITVDDMTKVSRQLMDSMGGIMDGFFIFGIVMFMLIIYLLSKIIVEKNAQSISMTKILGYTNGEINGLYVMTTSMVVIASFIIIIPIVNALMEYICIIMMSDFSGWLPYYVPFSAYLKIVMCGIISYAAIAFIQYRKVKKISLSIALKNVE